MKLTYELRSLLLYHAAKDAKLGPVFIGTEAHFKKFIDRFARWLRNCGPITWTHMRPTRGSLIYTSHATIDKPPIDRIIMLDLRVQEPDTTILRHFSETLQSHARVGHATTWTIIITKDEYAHLHGLTCALHTHLQPFTFSSGIHVLMRQDDPRSRLGAHLRAILDEYFPQVRTFSSVPRWLASLRRDPDIVAAVHPLPDKANETDSFMREISSMVASDTLVIYIPYGQSDDNSSR